MKKIILSLLMLTTPAFADTGDVTDVGAVPDNTSLNAASPNTLGVGTSTSTDVNVTPSAREALARQRGMRRRGTGTSTNTFTDTNMARPVSPAMRPDGTVIENPAPVTRPGTGSPTGGTGSPSATGSGSTESGNTGTTNTGTGAP